MKEKKVRVDRLLITGILTIMFLTTFTSFAQETKWIAVGRLHDWYHSSGCEQEVGRTFLIPDQQDGLRWPAEYKYQDVKAAKALWIGTTNYSDPLFNNTEFGFKVVHTGPRFLDEINETMPQEFRLLGRFHNPQVLVDGVPASKLTLMGTGLNEEDIVPDLPADRMLLNVVNTSIGITMTRKVYGWGRKKHDNYFILDFVFKNTGIYNNQGSTHNKTLTGVVFYWQYRYAPTREPGPYGTGGYWVPQSSSWGHSTMNDAIFTHPVTSELFRCLFTWYGKHSKWGGPAGSSSIGAPFHGVSGDGHFGAPHYVGTLVLHADTSPSDPNDDPSQPTTTDVLGSDANITTAGTDQFSGPRMAEEYEAMTAGHAPITQAQRVLATDEFSDIESQTGGGFSQTHGFGPYTLAPGDSIHIVIAEGVAGLDRQFGREIGEQWKADSGPFIGPEGEELPNQEEFKNAWIYTGEDSLFKTLSLAKVNYESGYNIPYPPPPPAEFTVESGGDRISLSWSDNAESWPGFAGYKIYRAIFTGDTTFTEIFACGDGTDNALTNTYDDKAPIRGFDYYYYVTSFDDGNSGAGMTLESSRFYTQTNEPAYLRRPAGTNLSDIRVVPNPYNIRARDLQYGTSAPDRIMFLNIPPFCTIRIFTERGDLINTLEHSDGSGDEAWNLITSSRQTVVSGVYIGHIEVTQDFTDPESGTQVFKKGDNHIVKFAVVR